jgi:1-acyl-sn-glycerol-3-phosphate acyltransferase
VTSEAPTKPAPNAEKEWKPFPKAGYTPLYYIAGSACRLFYWLYGRWRIVGLENVPRNGGVLLAGNHVSQLDPPMVGGALFGYRRVRFMAKVELWASPLSRYVMDRTMSFPVKRGTADRPTIRRTLEWLAQGDAIAIFPEGERSEDGTLRSSDTGRDHWNLQDVAEGTEEAQARASQNRLRETDPLRQGRAPRGHHERGDDGHRGAAHRERSAHGSARRRRQPTDDRGLTGAKACL